MKFPLLEGVVNTVATTPTTWSNGLPFDDSGALCISTNSIATWSNGIPFDSEGSVVVNDGGGGGINKWPVLGLDFTTGTLDSRITFTRASGATYTDSTGTLQTATSNTPRFDYDPVTLEKKGLLIEEQRTNLLTYSEQFDNAAWTKNETTISANATSAPDGLTTADKFQENTSTNYHGVNTNPSASYSTAYTWSCYAKAAERNYLHVNFSVINARATFNLTTGATSVLNGAATVSATSVGGGWYKCTATVTTPATGTNVLFHAFGPAFDSATTSYAGTAGSGIYIWGAQLEAGSFATSYIPTTTAQATRAADVAVMTGSNFSSWYNQSEGTWFEENEDMPSAVWLCPSDGTTSNRLDIQSVSNTGFQSRMVVSGAQTWVDAVALPVLGTKFVKHATAYGATNAISYDGGTIVSGTGTNGTFNQLRIGARTDGATPINGHIKSLAYYNTRLSDTQLQTLTA